MTETTFGSLASEARRSASTAAEGVSDAASRAADATSDLASRAARAGDEAVGRLNDADAAGYFRLGRLRSTGRISTRTGFSKSILRVPLSGRLLITRMPPRPAA